jgi:putative aminopeptidase FrvX
VDGKLFETLVSTPGISGREERIREVVKKEMEGLVDEVRIDRLGNLIGMRKGSGSKVMLSAHMDSIGFLVRHIDNDGFLRLSPVGGFDPRTLVMQKVVVLGKKEYIGLVSPQEPPIHKQKKEDREKAPKLDDIFVDLMVPADEVKANVSIGDPISLYRAPEVTDRAVTAPYLDDRLGVYCLIEALRAAKTTAEIHAVVSVQEEVGVRGATTSAFDLEPDIGVALDVSIAGDLPGTEGHQRGLVQGEGVAVSVMDSMTISDSRLVKRFQELADEKGIKYQLDILLGGGTDAGGIQLTKAGVPVITIGPPVRYVHTVNEMALISDIDCTVQLLSTFLESVHELSLEW